MNMGLTTIALIAIIGGSILLLVSMSTTDEGNKLLAQFQPAANILSPIVLILTVGVLAIQLRHIQDQNDLQRNVASKSSIQALNEVILKDEKFMAFIFPEPIDARKPQPEKDQARESMMAFSLMNSLEMLYLTQRERVPRDDFKRLLKGFTMNVREHWKKEFPTVYHPDFQKIVEEVFDEMDQAAEQAR